MQGMSETSWIDHMHERLRALLPSETLTIGELYEEVKTEISLHHLHHAMREANRWNRKKDAEGNPVPVGNEKAVWMYCLHHLRILRIENLDNRGPGQGHYWRYSDRVRLKPVDGKACPKCGGPVIKLRGGAGVRREEKRFACQLCDNPLTPPARVAIEALEPLPPLPVEQAPPPNHRTVGPFTLLPGMPDADELFRNRVISGQLVLQINATDRRQAARALRDLIPMAKAMSINALAQRIEAAHDNLTAVMRSFGVSRGKDLVELIERRDRYNKMRALDPPPYRP